MENLKAELKQKTIAQPMKEVPVEKKAEPVIIPPEKEIVQPTSVITQEKETTPPVSVIVEEKIIEHLQPVIQQPVIPQKEPIQKPVVPKKKTDFEKFIGENLISKIGIIVLVLGLGFLVKYAIDKNWINEVARVAIGILSGAALIGLAHWMRKSYKPFSSVLIGGGLAVLYITIAIAFHQYHLFSQTAAFIIMIIITFFAVLLSIAYDRIELAVLAMLGGFGTPFFVSTGEGNYVVLFTYFMILNVGMLVLSYYKKWYLVNIVAFVFTVIIYGGWLITAIHDNKSYLYKGALIFAGLFYATFFLMNIINNVKEKQKFRFGEISILLSNTALFYAAGMGVLSQMYDGKLKGIFTILLAIYNLAFAIYLYYRKQVDRNLVYLLIGFVLTFLSLTAPVQLNGNYITLFWALESVLLLWFSQKSGIKVVKIASVVVTFLMLFSLLVDWTNIYNFSTATINYVDPNNPDILTISHLPVIFNKGFITSIFSLAALALTIFMLRYEEKPESFIGIGVKAYKWILFPFFIIYLYVAVLLELNYHVKYYIDIRESQHIIIGLYNMVFIFGLMLWTRVKSVKIIFEIATGLAFIGIFSYLVYYNRQIYKVSALYLTGTDLSLSHFMIHYPLILCVAAIVILFYKNIVKIFNPKSVVDVMALWFIVFVSVFMASAELDQLVLISQYRQGDSFTEILTQSHKIGFPILWGIGSLILMTIGMRAKNRRLRIISLSLFFITLFKLFIFDIRGIHEAGKIAAFISLGILLLVVSFMYQKLKKILLEDDAVKNKTAAIT
ncbi:MAG: DUF2339 domain-containing protein [Bacteroidia bacterium]|nr:DUF2339 domain-containing protein [Bacteroidia bacterium]